MLYQSHLVMFLHFLYYQQDVLLIELLILVIKLMLNYRVVSDMYRNSIKFYQDLINGIPSDRVIDLSDADKRNIE